MITERMPVQGPMTVEQTEDFKEMMLMMVRRLPITEMDTRDKAVALVCKAHADVMEATALPIDGCTITGDVDCKSRHCEIHYMDAPLQLEPADPRL